MDATFLILMAVYHPFFLFFFTRPFFRIYRMMPRGQRVYFHITDYWCAVVGLAPSFYAVSVAVKSVQAGSPHATWHCIMAYLLATSQLAGLFIGRIHNQVPVAQRSLWTEIGWNIAGAAFGLLLVGLSALTFVLLPGIVPVGICYWLLYKVSRK